MKRFTCDDGCCHYQTISYNRKKSIRFFNKEKLKKAGIFITSPQSLTLDTNTQELFISDGYIKVLLVQSKGQFWGPPKGSLEPEESIIEAAIREVKEETGLEFDSKELGEIKFIKGSCFYFHISIDEIPLEIQTTLEGNDANGIGWFRLDCLDNMIKSGKIQINQHCTLLLKKILKYNISSNIQPQRLPKTCFIKF